MSSRNTNSSGTWNGRQRALGSGVDVGCWGKTSEGRAVITVKDVKQATEERELITTSQSFMEMPCFPSYQKLGSLSSILAFQLLKGNSFHV